MPIEVPGVTAATQLSSASNHTCALTAAAQVYCWGLSTVGQRGRGVTNPLTANLVTLPAGFVPVRVVAGTRSTYIFSATKVLVVGQLANIYDPIPGGSLLKP